MFRLTATCLALSLVLAAGCAGPTTPVTESTVRNDGIKPMVVTSLFGTVSAPAGVIAAGGANAVAAGGGNVIAGGGANVVPPGGANVVPPGGANVVASGGGNLTQAPLANAEVYLADAAGQPLPGIASARTDDKGMFRFFNVPEGYTFMVVAPVKTEHGEQAALQTLAHSSKQSAKADLDVATTAVTAAVTQEQHDLGELDPAAFGQATAAAAKALGQGKPSLSDRNGLAAAAVADPGAKAAVEALRTQVADTHASSLEALKKELAARVKSGKPWMPDDGLPASQAPQALSPTPSAAPAVVPSEAPAAAAPSPTPTPSPSPTPLSQPVMQRLTLFPNLQLDFFKAAKTYPLAVRFVSADGAFDRRYTVTGPTSRVADTFLCGAFLTVTYTPASGAAVTVKNAVLPAVDPGVEAPLPF